MAKTIRVGVIGMGWMGTVHSRAYLNIADRFRHADISASLVACADEVETRARDAQSRFGFTRSTTNWREVVADPEIDMVVITTSNNTHLEMVQAGSKSDNFFFIRPTYPPQPVDFRA